MILQMFSYEIIQFFGKETIKMNKIYFFILKCKRYITLSNRIESLDVSNSETSNLIQAILAFLLWKTCYTSEIRWYYGIIK